MLKFSKRNAMSTLVLLMLSLSTMADTGLDGVTDQNHKPTSNLVELFKVKERGTEYIKGIEEKLAKRAEEEVSKLIGLQQSNTGGGCMCWVFGEERRELFFGYAGGNLGASYTNDSESEDHKSLDLKEGVNAQEQAAFIKETVKVLGFKF